MWVSPNRLRELMFFMLTGKHSPRPPIIRIHNRHGHGCTGDLSFPYDIDSWRNCIDAEPKDFDDVEDILTYYKNKALDNPKSENWDTDNILIAFKRDLVKNYNDLYLTDSAAISLLFEVTLLTNNTVVLVFHAKRLSHFVIKHVLAEGVYYGYKPYQGKRFKLTVDPDEESEVTNLRLNVLRRAIKNLLKSQGFRTAREDGYSPHYLLSTNDKLLEKDQDFKYEIIRCAKVLDNVKWAPETKTRDAYLRHKMKKIREIVEQRCHDIYVDPQNAERDIVKYANAAATHELLTVDYFESVLLESSQVMDTSTTEAVYILHTNVRITSILDKYARLVVRDEFPRIPDLQDLPCLEKSGDVASWHMIFDYIIEFPDILEKTLYDNPKLIINIPLLWKFCYNLCKDFTKYYDTHPVILTGSNKTEKSIFDNTTERIYILKALRVVLRDALFLLGVDEVTYM